MATLLKVFMGLMVIVCLAQFVKMDPEEDANETVNKILSQLSKQIDNALNDENFKNLIVGGKEGLSEAAKTLESQMKTWKESLDQIKN